LIVASVSCRYGLGSPEEYGSHVLSLRPGQDKHRVELLSILMDVQYARNDLNIRRGTFWVRGDSIEIIPASREEQCVRIEFFGDEIDRIREVDAMTGEIVGDREHIAIFPASHYVTREDKLKLAIKNIKKELDERLKELNEQGKLLEA